MGARSWSDHCLPIRRASPTTASNIISSDQQQQQQQNQHTASHTRSFLTTATANCRDLLGFGSLRDQTSNESKHSKQQVHQHQVQHKKHQQLDANYPPSIPISLDGESCAPYKSYKKSHNESNLQNDLNKNQTHHNHHQHQAQQYHQIYHHQNQHRQINERQLHRPKSHSFTNTSRDDHEILRSCIKPPPNKTVFDVPSDEEKSDKKSSSTSLNTSSLSIGSSSSKSKFSRRSPSRASTLDEYSNEYEFNRKQSPPPPYSK